MRYAGRLLRKTPGFTATALATLAVCIGANLTIFAVVDSILLRPLPFPEPGRLAIIFNTYPKAGVERDGSSISNYYERRGRVPAFASLSIYRYGSALVGAAGSTEREQIARVSPEFFRTLGTGPALGRTFTEEETSPATDNVVILTDTYWRQHFHSDPNVIGKQMRMDGTAHTIVGVLPPGFRFLSSEARLYVPFSSRPEDRAASQRHSGGGLKHLIARLKPGATFTQAQAQIDAQNAALEADDSQAEMLASAGFRSIVAPLHADYVASVRSTLLAMQAGAIVLLLIGAVNLANLLMIRASSRVKELAVRQALGASRLHVMSEVMVETSLLTIAGGLLGLAAGAAGIRVVETLGANLLPLGNYISFDGRVAWIALAGSAALGLALATPVALFSFRKEGSDAMRTASRSSTGSRAAQRLRHAFVVAQIALSFVLLVTAGLLGLSLARAMAVAPGFRPDHVLTAAISLPKDKYPNWQARLAFNARFLKAISVQPGVVAAGLVNNLPLGGATGKSTVTVKGHVLRPGESARGHYAYGVDGDYFAAMGLSLKEGRFLTADDSRRPERVCVVDEDFARYYWPHGNAVGQRLFRGPEAGNEADAFTVVGVTGAVKQAGLTEETAQGAVYYPYELRTDTNLFVAVRSTVPPESLAPALERVVRRIDAEAAVSDARAMDARISDSLVTQRSPAAVATIFAAIALLLTAIGAYGVLSYAVAQRRREIGVRIALGARPGQIRSQFLALAARLLVAGIVIGGVGSWLAGEAIRSLLFEAAPFQLAVFAAASGAIGTISLAACLLPSHRASRISPTEALLEH